MTIVEMLKSEDVYYQHVTVGNRWLVWDKARKQFIVYEKKPYQKKSRVIIDTTFEDIAVGKLIED